LLTETGRGHRPLPCFLRKAPVENDTVTIAESRGGHRRRFSRLRRRETWEACRDDDQEQQMNGLKDPG